MFYSKSNLHVKHRCLTANNDNTSKLKASSNHKKEIDIDSIHIKPAKHILLSTNKQSTVWRRFKILHLKVASEIGFDGNKKETTEQTILVRITHQNVKPETQ